MVLAPCQRPRNAAATREAILKAANERFAAESYEQVGMRDIARDVGVDPALISRYFGSKEELFSAVLNSCGDPSELLSIPRADFGRYVAEDLVYGEKNEQKLRWLFIMLRSISSSSVACEAVKCASQTNFYRPFTAWIGGEDAEVKVRLAAGLMMGLKISREMNGGFDLSPEDSRKLCDRIAVVLQGIIDA